MCCLDGGPHEKDPYLHFNQRQWETTMVEAPCNNVGGCCFACFCPCCSAYTLRKRALQGDMTKYKCCQGYICPQCCATDSCYERTQQCPDFCLACECLCCLGFSISGTRIYVQEERQIMTDPCDNRLIRFNNVLQILACICQCLAIIFKPLKDLAQLIRCIADIVYWTTQACMQAQVDLEMKIHPTAANYSPVTNQPVAATDKAPLMSSAPPQY
eukprot:m.333875 g.333875  ORF g.333875 m.333875 type:complete len:214 (+) comp17236_c0_seq1:93-734(+)